jgi:hypothetical protein
MTGAPDAMLCYGNEYYYKLRLLLYTGNTTDPSMLVTYLQLRQPVW